MHVSTEKRMIKRASVERQSDKRMDGEIHGQTVRQTEGKRSNISHRSVRT